MTKPKNAPKRRKAGRPPHDLFQVYIAVEATSRVSGLSINALSARYKQTVASQDRSPREWPTISGKSIGKFHSRMRVVIFGFAEKMAETGSPDLLQRCTATVDRIVNDYIDAQGLEWRVSVKDQGDAIRQLRSRQYRREGVRHVKPKRPVHEE